MGLIHLLVHRPARNHGRIGSHGRSCSYWADSLIPIPQERLTRTKRTVAPAVFTQNLPQSSLTPVAETLHSSVKPNLIRASHVPGPVGIVAAQPLQNTLPSRQLLNCNWGRALIEWGSLPMTTLK